MEPELREEAEKRMKSGKEQFCANSAYGEKTRDKRISSERKIAFKTGRINKDQLFIILFIRSKYGILKKIIEWLTTSKLKNHQMITIRFNQEQNE